jgi:protein-disulfide isomerase
MRATTAPAAVTEPVATAPAATTTLAAPTAVQAVAPTADPLAMPAGSVDPSQPVDSARLVDDPALGSTTAPVTIVEYGDFGCPSCRAWHRAGILSQIRAQYGEQVRFVWRDFPVITPRSPQAAEAAQCAYDQGRFWDYHDYLYERAQSLSLGALKAAAAGLQLDTAKFSHCLDSHRHAATVERDLDDALAHRFRGTPSFLINEQPLIGPPSFEILQQTIDAILASR